MRVKCRFSSILPAAGGREPFLPGKRSTPGSSPARRATPGRAPTPCLFALLCSQPQQMAKILWRCTYVQEIPQPIASGSLPPQGTFLNHGKAARLGLWQLWEGAGTRGHGAACPAACRTRHPPASGTAKPPPAPSTKPQTVVVVGRFWQRRRSHRFAAPLG